MTIPDLLRRGARKIIDRGHPRPTTDRVEIQRIQPDLDLIVLPEVFPPAKCLTTKILVEQLELLGLKAGQRALDMGTGSGAAAVTLAKMGLTVDAVDINPFAVRCAKLNALMHGVEKNISVFHGNLFEPLASGQYDIIVFNPPYLDGIPSRWYEHAFYGGNDGQVLDQFLTGAATRLKPTGMIILSYSTVANTDRLNRQVKASAFKAREIHRQDFIAEIITHHALTFQ